MASSEFQQDYNQLNDFLTKQFDTRDFLQELEEILQGFRYDSETKKYISIKEEGFLNHIGAKQVINTIKGVIGNINSSSRLSRANIYEMREDIYYEMIKVLAVNHEGYELESYHLDSVLGLIDRAVFCFLSRTEEASFFNKLSGFFKKSETQTYVQQMPNQEPKKRWSI